MTACVSLIHAISFCSYLYDGRRLNGSDERIREDRAARQVRLNRMGVHVAGDARAGVPCDLRSIHDRDTQRGICAGEHGCQAVCRRECGTVFDGKPAATTAALNLRAKFARILGRDVPGRLQVRCRPTIIEAQLDLDFRIVRWEFCATAHGANLGTAYAHRNCAHTVLCGPLHRP